MVETIAKPREFGRGKPGTGTSRLFGATGSLRLVLFAPVGGIDRRGGGPQSATGGAGGRLRGDILRVGVVAVDPRHALAHHLEIHILAAEPHYAEDVSEENIGTSAIRSG